MLSGVGVRVTWVPACAGMTKTEGRGEDGGLGEEGVEEWDELLDELEVVLDGLLGEPHFVGVGVEGLGCVEEWAEGVVVGFLDEVVDGLVEVPVGVVGPAAVLGVGFDDLGGGEPGFFGGLAEVACCEFVLGLLEEVACCLAVGEGLGGGHVGIVSHGGVGGVRWVPACAGKTKTEGRGNDGWGGYVGSRLRGNDGKKRGAGMTGGGGWGGCGV